MNVKIFVIVILKSEKECYEYEISDSDMNKRFRLFRVIFTLHYGY